MSTSTSMWKIHLIIKIILSLCSSHHPPTDCKKKADLRQLHLGKLENVWTFFGIGGKARIWVNTRTVCQKSEELKVRCNQWENRKFGSYPVTGLESLSAVIFRRGMHGRMGPIKISRIVSNWIVLKWSILWRKETCFRVNGVDGTDKIMPLRISLTQTLFYPVI